MYFINLVSSHNLTFIYVYKNIYIYGFASKFGYGSARGDPDVWIGLDHRHFGLDRGYGSACGFRVWIGLLHFDSQPNINEKSLWCNRINVFGDRGKKQASRSD